jgi:uncharacterized RDD family membrane protein YckC
MFQEKISLETPEHVAVEFEVAGPMSRYAAALYDGIILGVSFALLILLFAILAAVTDGFGGAGDAFLAVGLVLLAVAFFGYFPLFEHFMKGQTPGKRALGIRVMRRDMAPLDFTSVFVRGVLRIVDVLPGLPFPAVGLVTMTVSRQGLRLGDMAAGTWVVRDPDIRPLLDGKAKAVPRARVPAPPAPGAGPPAPARLTLEEYRIAFDFLERAPALDQVQRRAAALRIAGPILRRLGEEQRVDAEAFLREEVAKGSAGRSLL